MAAKPRPYAASTRVSADQSQAQIQALAQKYGAQNYTVSLRAEGVLIGFELGGRAVKLTLPFPPPDAREFTHSVSKGGWVTERSARAARENWEQVCRARWRALLLVVRAKLEAIEAGILEIDEAFFADVVTETGATVYERYQAEALPVLPRPARLTLPEGKK